MAMQTKKRLYVKKLIPVEAFQWDGQPNTIRQNVPYPASTKYFDILWNRQTSYGYTLRINTLEGAEKCPFGNYIIKGVHGEYYSCDPKIFHETYIAVDDITAGKYNLHDALKRMSDKSKKHKGKKQTDETTFTYRS